MLSFPGLMIRSISPGVRGRRTRGSSRIPFPFAGPATSSRGSPPPYTFHTNSDDGVRLWVNGQLLIDNWTIHPPTENTGTITLTAGRWYEVKLEYYQAAGGATIQLFWSSPSQPKQIVPNSQLYVPVSSWPTDELLSPFAYFVELLNYTCEHLRIRSCGLVGVYFNNSDLTDVRFSRVDGTVNFAWGTGSPDPRIEPDTFSVRWTGYLEPRFSETYTFHTNSDDGVRLWVNGQLLIDNWTIHPPTENTGTIALTAGQRYQVTLEYYQAAGGATIQLFWSSPSQPKQIIPRVRLYTNYLDEDVDALTLRTDLHQPFDRLLDCRDKAGQDVAQVRVCAEALRSHLARDRLQTGRGNEP